MDGARNKPVLTNKIIDLKCCNINNKQSWFKEMTNVNFVTKPYYNGNSNYT